MIKSEGKAANKNLRIYRPDISLPEICGTNGPAIVRKMIPCFSFPDKVYNDVYKVYSDKRKKLIKKGNNCFKGPNDPKFTFVYGLNVRTPRINDVLPFFTTYIYDTCKEEGRLVDDYKVEGIELTVPQFTDTYKIRELTLYATVQADGTILKDDITILSLTTDEKLLPERIDTLKKDLHENNSFFTKQVNALGIRHRAFMWLTSEDYNVNTAGDALSNMIAISDDYDAIEKYIIPHRLDFINLLFLIKSRYLFDTEIAQRKTAIASAKAAIMSRNMSHNLGSHVMAYLKQHLNSVQDMVRDNVLASLFSPKDILTPEGLENWYESYKKTTQKEKEIALPFLVGLGKFISYLQERQDFIATIATNYVPYFSTVNFKDFVFDELNPDLRYERHKDRIGLQPDNILLGNIARSEGLARSTNPTKNKQMADIVIKYKTFNGKPVSQLSDDDPRKLALTDMRDFMVYLPGGVVGRQAIFSIVENVIRNAAKHGKWGDKGDNSLELTFDRFYLEDYQKGLLKDDFVPKGDDSFKDFFKKYYAAASDINDLCVITLTDNISFEKAGTKKKNCKNLESIREALIEAYIDNASVEMLQTNKGIKEMRISAAWMRGVEDNVKINPLYITPDFDTKKKKDPEDHWIKVKPIKPTKPGENATPEEIDTYNKELNLYKEELKTFEYKYWKKNQWINRAPILMVRACSNNPDEDYHLQYVFCLQRPKQVAIVLPDSYFEKHNLDKVKEWFTQKSWGLFSANSFLDEHNKSYEFILLADGIDKDMEDDIKQLSPNRVFTQQQIKSFITIDKTILTTQFNDFTAILSELYKLLSDFDPKSDVIVISDEKVNGRNDLSNIKPDNIKIYDGAFEGRYLYRTHNETEHLFTDYLKKADSNTLFVEGITGNNSTDRLVRNDKIDDIWLYKHLHAMKTSVGIFDERIFAKVFKKDEADIRISKLPFVEFRRHLSNNASDDEIKKKIRKCKTEEEINDILGCDAREILGDYMAIAYEKKGVSIFNLLKKKNGLDIYGFDTIVWDKQGEHCYGRITKIGSIESKKGSFIIKNIRNQRFDYLTIHQGLLDKVYEQFGIRHDAKAKHLFTKAFYEAFSNDPSYITYKDKMIPDKSGNPDSVFYLPNLRIHSGRSKPSFADMPQHQPFMQYAAIEHAVMDCKYSLVELLDFARYEK